MKIQIGIDTITIELFESETTKDFVANCPPSLTMERYDDREYYAVLDFHPSLDGEHIEDFSNGDVTYFPDLNTLAIFFTKEGISSVPGLIRIGRVVSDLSIFDSLDEKINCELNLA